MAKGTPFEREMCRLLSEWWTGGKRDDIYWRTDGSGGRATNRAKKGKQTANSVGDVGALDPYGQPLLDLAVIELKRGYPSSTCVAALDRNPKIVLSDRTWKATWEGWVEKVRLEAIQGGVPFWWIIHRRDRRLAMLFFPKAFLFSLPDPSLLTGLDTIVMHIGGREIWGVRLSDFLAVARPDDVRTASKLPWRRRVFRVRKRIDRGAFPVKRVVGA